jgi:hypothetical protein
MRFGAPNEDPEAEIAAGVVGRLFRERQLERYWTWRATQTSYPNRWREAAVDNQHVFYVTVEELEELNRELVALLLPRYRERVTDPSLRPAGAVPVETLVMSYPMQMPKNQDGASAPEGSS